MTPLANKYGNTKHLQPHGTFKTVIANGSMGLVSPTVCINISSAITTKHSNPTYIKAIIMQHKYLHFEGFQNYTPMEAKNSSQTKWMQPPVTPEAP